jgi:hypothetical protein
MDTHHRIAAIRGLVRDHLTAEPHVVNGVQITFIREMMDGVLVVYMTGTPNMRQERVAFFTTGTIDNQPAVRFEWDKACEAQ